MPETDPLLAMPDVGYKPGQRVVTRPSSGERGYYFVERSEIYRNGDIWIITTGGFARPSEIQPYDPELHGEWLGATHQLLPRRIGE